MAPARAVSTPVHSGFDALLPSIPNNVRPSKKVIMSKLDELQKGPRPASVCQSRPASRATRPSSRADSLDGGFSQSAPSQMSMQMSRSRGTAEPSKKGKGISGLLYMKDQSLECKHLETIVTPCSKGLDYVAYDEAKKEEASIWTDGGWQGENSDSDEFTETMPSFMASTAHQTSTSSSFKWTKSNLLQNNKFRINMISFRPIKVKQKPPDSVIVRQRRLQEQFARTENEIRQAKDELEKLMKQPMIAKWLDATTNIQEEFPVVTDLLKQFMQIGIGLVPELPPSSQAQTERKLFPGKTKDDTLAFSDIQEKHVALTILNYYRWLCGCPPMMHDRYAHRVCKMVAETLLPRSQLILRPDDPRADRILKFGNKLTDFLTKEGTKICVLQLEASLSDAVSQSLNASFVNDPRRPHVIPRGQLIHDFISARIAYAKEQGEVPEQQDHYHDAPASLQSLRILWDLASSTKRRGATGHSSIQHEDVAHLVSEGTRLARKLYTAATLRKHKVRTIDMKGKDKVGPREPGGILGDIGSAVNFRRFLLNPDLVYFGGHRMQDTCVFWSGHATHGQQDNAEAEGGARQEEQEQEAVQPGEHQEKTPAASEKQTSAYSKYAALSHRASSDSNYSTVDEEPGREKIRPLTPSQQEKKGVGEQFVPKKNENIPPPICFNPPARDHKVSCFPPAGIVPIESVQGLKEWSVMPHYSCYQPTQALEVEMWRVRITPPSASYPEYVAERLSAVKIDNFAVDCSPKGNPFCVIFTPNIVEIYHGDAFEVRVTGLTGQDGEINTFHEFRRLQMDPDICLNEEAAKFRKLLDNKHFWGPKQETYLARIGATGQPGVSDKNAQVEEQKKNEGRRPNRTLTKVEEVNVNTIDIGLVTHPETTFDTSNSEVKIVVIAPVTAMRTSLWLVRNTGSVEVARASIAHKLGNNRWLIHALLPMPASRYELQFEVGITENPGPLERHRLTYLIGTTEKSQVMLVSLDTPMFASFGFPSFSSFNQWKNITIVSPLKHRLGTGHVYFLVHIEEATKGQLGETTRMCLSKLFTTRRISTLIETGELGKGNRTFSKETKATIGKVKNAFTDLSESMKGASTQSADMIKEVQRILAEGCSNVVQQNLGAIHLDLSVNRGKYRIRLQQRKDFPELFEALVNFSRSDFNVELFFRGLQSTQYAPVKIAEWTCDGYRDIYR